MGTARVYLEIARDGSLLQAGLMTLERVGEPRPRGARGRRAARALPGGARRLPGASFAFDAGPRVRGALSGRSRCGEFPAIVRGKPPGRDAGWR